MDNAKEREKLFYKLKEELWRRELSNAEAADKAVLAYSSAGLGFSLAFLKDFLPITKASCGWLLYLSWALFTLAIVITITSYIISQLGLKRQESRSECYYLKQDEKAFEQKNIFEKLTIWFNICSCLSFVIAIVVTTLFVSINLERATKMTEQKKVESQEGAFKAATIPSMQKIDTTAIFGEAAPIPPIQQVSQPQPQQQLQPSQPQQQGPTQPQQQGPTQNGSPTSGAKE